jgi:hypothetical protein
VKNAYSNVPKRNGQAMGLSFGIFVHHVPADQKHIISLTGGNSPYIFDDTTTDGL